MSNLTELENRVDALSLRLIVPLRTAPISEKMVDQSAMDELGSVMKSIAIALGDRDMVPRRLVGKLLHIFTALLDQANHASNRWPIYDAAWRVADQMDRIFGGPEGLDPATDIEATWPSGK